MSAIELNAVSKVFKRRKGNVEALNAVSLTVNEGEVFGFVGPNGAGKSTTIKIILNIISDYEGEARIFGVDARHAVSRRHVGYVPEAPALYEQLTPLEILRAGMDLHGIQNDDPQAWCMRWLERFSIGHTATRRVRELSKGTAQRVALAHAMAVSPRLLILDEPLSGLDPVGRKDVVDILSEYQQGGGTIFLTSHVLHDVERLADRFGLIHKGELKTISSPNELVGNDELVTVRSYGTAQLPQMRAESGGRWFCELPRASLWELLRALDSAGHTVIEIKPTLSLESAFMRYLGLSQTGTGTKP
ncbi:MAG TPA: ABC transporter ATP-binding protein [Rhodocyclaceae bacterium]|nr:ABC transporter ATP-binding protein [Rhodocyclaceae bacterium]